MDKILAIFDAVFYLSITLGYLLRWSWGEKNNLVVLVATLICAMPVIGNDLLGRWRKRLYLLMGVGLGLGVVGAQFSFFEYGRTGFFQFVVVLSFAIPLIYFSRVFLIRLPDPPENAWSNKPITDETRYFQMTTYITAGVAAIIWVVFIPIYDVPRSIVYWLLLGLPVLTAAVFGAGWAYQVGYHCGWQDGKAGKADRPRLRFRLIQGGKAEAFEPPAR